MGEETWNSRFDCVVEVIVKESHVAISKRVEFELMHGPSVHWSNVVREVCIQEVWQRVPLAEMRFFNPGGLQETCTVMRTRVNVNSHLIHLIGVQVEDFDYLPTILVTRGVL